MPQPIETMAGLRGRESWAGPGTTARAWVRGVAAAALLTLMTPSPGTAASDWVLRAVLSEDAAIVEEALLELEDALHGPLDGQRWSADSAGAFFREDVDLASWFGEVLAKGRPEARDAVSQFFLAWMVWSPVPPEWIEFAARNHLSAQEMFEGWPQEEMLVDEQVLPTMERLRSEEDGGGVLAWLSETVADDEARRLALAFASQMKRVQAALPGLVEEEYDRRRGSETMGSDPVRRTLLASLVFLQELGTEETRAAAWATWVKKREAQGLPTVVVGVEAPWKLFPVFHELDEADQPIEGRALPPGVRRVALALTKEVPAELGPEYVDGNWESRHSVEALEYAATLLANERPLAEETGRRIFDLYCGMPVGIRHCFEQLNLLYAGPDDPSLRSMEADVRRHLVKLLVGLTDEIGRQCGTLAELEAEGPEDALAIGAARSRAEGRNEDRTIGSVRSRIHAIGSQLRDVLALAVRLDWVPRPFLEDMFEFSSTERLVLEKNGWLGPDVGARKVKLQAGFGWSRSVGVSDICEGSV